MLLLVSHDMPVIVDLWEASTDGYKATTMLLHTKAESLN